MLPDRDELGTRFDRPDVALVAVTVTDFYITLATQMVWHKDKWLSPALRAFAGVARRATHSLPLAGPAANA